MHADGVIAANHVPCKIREGALVEQGRAERIAIDANQHSRFGGKKHLGSPLAQRLDEIDVGDLPFFL